MGEANLKRRRRQAFLQEHPYCCFCGGKTAATTVDHVPSRQMFSQRRRPKGLEVPACDKCNQATRQYEQVAALLGRIYPDGPTKADKREMAGIMAAVNRNVPGLLEELMPSKEQAARFVRSAVPFPGARGVLNCAGPLLNHSIQRFGAKLGFALHYATTGHIVPEGGGVAVRWYSNYDAVTGEIPPELFQFLGPDQTLRQGKWSAGDQFNYAYAAPKGTPIAAYFSTFRIAFAVLSWVSENKTLLRNINTIHVPGKV